MLIAYLAALGCAVGYGLASVLQSIGAQRVEAGESLDPRSLAKVATQLPYLVGLGLDGTSWLLSLVALAELPLFVVQAVVAGAIGFVVFFSALIQKVRPTTKQIVFLVVLFAGLAGLAISGAPEEARRTSAGFSWAMCLAALAIGAAGIVAPRVLQGTRASAVMGTLAGLAFGGTALCARSLVADVSVQDLRDPLLWAMALYGIMGLVFFAAALQRGAAMVATACLFTAETVVPALIGMAVLGDEARSGMIVIAIGSFVITVVAAVGLALISPPMEG